ncbi:MAG TPA: hypothetical protein VNF00_02665 [Candidatus Acidoferrales bacterium]|nr:hypothetical protein [Candidatus Acidoferrales bacterium]
MQINPKLGTAGLIYASLLGGSQSDQAMSIAVDTSAPPAAYITGVTHSPDFIPSSGVTNAPYQSGLDGSSNAFVTVINQTAEGVPSLEYESYLGGTGSDTGQGIAVLSPTQVYIAGSAASADFPVLCSLQGFSGNQDAFLAEFNPTLSGAASLVYTTLLGGSVTTEANAVAADSAGDAIIFGDTMSHDYPLAGNANNSFQPTAQAAPPRPRLPMLCLQGLLPAPTKWRAHRSRQRWSTSARCQRAAPLRLSISRWRTTATRI